MKKVLRIILITVLGIIAGWLLGVLVLLLAYQMKPSTFLGLVVIVVWVWTSVFLVRRTLRRPQA